jgi:hypothetical protein
MIAFIHDHAFISKGSHKRPWSLLVVDEVWMDENFKIFFEN